ncbi:TPA: RTX iron-regulated FrpC family protein, partial [Neisseria meningitidis]
MRPYATTIYQLFILFIGSVFTMTSCEPVNEKTDQKAVSAQQAKEQTS